MNCTDTVPLVSVVIPAYNSAAYIGQALDSVYAQSFTDYEVIVVNDGSPDTKELSLALKPYEGRFIYLNQENCGPGGARNAAIRIARGQFIAFLDSDDYWLPDYLAAQLDHLLRDPTISLVCGDAYLVGDSALAGKTFMQLWPPNEPASFAKLVDMRCAVLTMCVVARKQALFDAGLFDSNFLRSEDYDLWLRLAYRGERFGYQNKVLAYHRIHTASLAADLQRLYQSQIDVYEKSLRTLDLSEDEQALIRQQIDRCNADLALEEGKEQILVRDYIRATERLSAANEYYRSRKLSIVLLGLRIAPRLVRYMSLRRSIAQAFTAAMRIISGIPFAG